jgi:hypothetical protein
MGGSLFAALLFQILRLRRVKLDPFKACHLAAFRIEKINIPQKLRDDRL